jgi:hypothetical protein
VKPKRECAPSKDQRPAEVATNENKANAPNKPTNKFFMFLNFSD